GNLLFDLAGAMQRPNWNLGYFVEVEVQARGRCSVQVRPYAYDPAASALQSLPAARESALLDEMHAQSQVLADDALFEQAWEDFCRSKRPEALASLFGVNRWLRFMLRKTPLVNLMLTKQSQRVVLNRIQCESHREVLETILKAG
ncbi:MAG: hypothetical protein KDA41_10360, partial [Planctomycetales bacterium]|nr:hypothetical protein [Planctomycetales bacterium]